MNSWHLYCLSDKAPEAGGLGVYIICRTDVPATAKLRSWKNLIFFDLFFQGYFFVYIRFFQQKPLVPVYTLFFMESHYRVDKTGHNIMRVHGVCPRRHAVV